MILASASPRRIDIMKQAGFSVRVCPQSVDETPRLGEHPTELVGRLARNKASACANTCETDEIVIAADTIVWDEAHHVLGKPSDEADAARMLRMLSGKKHHVSTGVAIWAHGRFITFVETTDVWFFELSDKEIEAYVATGDPMDKAGAYGYQSYGCTLVERIEGDYYNVVGLPIGRLAKELAKLTDTNKEQQ